jgi:hypothetical protein
LIVGSFAFAAVGFFAMFGSKLLGRYNWCGVQTFDDRPLPRAILFSIRPKSIAF